MFAHLSQQVQKKIFWSTAVQYVGKFLQLAIGIVTIKLVTNALGPEEYGLYGKISEYALFFATTANLGIFGNTVRKMSERPDDGKLFINALYLRVISAVAIFGLGVLYALVFIHDHAFTVGILFFLASLLFDYITSVCDGMLQANYVMGRATGALIIGRVINFSFVFLLIRFGVDHASLYFVAPLVASGVTAGLSLWFVRMKMPFVWVLDWALIRTLAFTSLPFGIINSINSAYFRFLPSFFAAKFLTGAQFGTYNISTHIASTAAIISTFLMFSTLPVFKQALKEQQLQKAQQIYKAIQKILTVAGILVVVAGTFLAPLAIRLLSGKEFIIKELWFVLPMLLLLAAVSYLYDLVLITLFAFEEDIWFLKREVMALLCAGIVFCSSLLIDDRTIKIAIVISAAIVGETFMVCVGMRKIRQYFSS